MVHESIKFEIKIHYLHFLVGVIFLHFFIFWIGTPDLHKLAPEISQTSRTPLKILTLGEKNGSRRNSVYIEPQTPQNLPMPKPRSTNTKNLEFKDLALEKTSIPNSSPKLVSNRPGQLPKSPSALSGLRYGNEDFRKLARDPLLQGGADILSSRKVALNFELPEGKKLDELNESELRLYGFLRRGALKYVASLASEIKEFELKNPHLKFPLTDNRQTLTGRLVYDSQGNLKQIKMVRWTNVDKLQDFFEKVLKRLDTLQNPPKELWEENGEFTVFVTLQING